LGLLGLHWLHGDERLLEVVQVLVEFGVIVLLLSDEVAGGPCAGEVHVLVALRALAELLLVVGRSSLPMLQVMGRDGGREAQQQSIFLGGIFHLFPEHTF
jgi:hypothetical protein